MEAKSREVVFSECDICQIPSFSGTGGSLPIIDITEARISWYFLEMFETFSMRARRVVFVARLKAGQRGAAMIDLGDLLLGILLEDQGMMGSFIPIMAEGHGPAPLDPLPSHTPSFPLAAPDELQEEIEKLLPQTKPVPTTIEIPISPDLKSAFDGAIHIQNTFNHKRIEPLHLMAAVLAQESSQYVKMLQDFGITKDQVLRMLKQPRPSEDE